MKIDVPMPVYCFVIFVVDFLFFQSNVAWCLFLLCTPSSWLSIFVRENGLEWNNPSTQPAKGDFCGQSCEELSVMDNVTVLYFDDIHFDHVRDDTRPCNAFWTFCCGGRGEQVQIESTFCFGCCTRGRDNRICIPVCCPEFFCPCIAKAELWVEDAPTAVRIIRDARDDAKRRLGLEADGIESEQMER